MASADRVELLGMAAVSNETTSASEMLDNTPTEQTPAEPIAELSTHRFECISCGYVYNPSDGVKKFGIARGTSFNDLDQNDFRCPVCRARIDAFRDIGPSSKPSGFEDNLNYGFGVNGLTPGQKNILIFGGLAFVVACFLSLYSLH